MITNNQVKLIRLLAQKKYRQQHKLFIAETPKVVNELLQSKFTIEKIFATETFVQKYSNINNIIEVVSEKDLSKISQLKTPNEVLAIVKQPNNVVKDININLVNLVLDGVNDPGNLGTIIRICDWFGVKNIVCSENTVDCYNPKVVQSSMGSILRCNIYYTDLLEFIEKKQGNFYGTTLNGKSIKKVRIKKPAFIVMGSESHGISNEILPLLNAEFTIDRVGQAESLNVAVATAISLFGLV